MMEYRHKDMMNLMSTSIMIYLAWIVVFTSSEEPDVLESGRPERCVGSATLLYRFCCVLPPFFTRNVSQSCGAGVARLFDVANVTGLKRHAFTCDHWICVLRKYTLLNENAISIADTRLDLERFYAHLDVWATLNPSFTDVLSDAKLNCKMALRFSLPLGPCEFPELLICLRNYIKTYCPVTLPTPECNEQTTFFKDCGKYFI